MYAIDTGKYGHGMLYSYRLTEIIWLAKKFQTDVIENAERQPRENKK